MRTLSPRRVVVPLAVLAVLGTGFAAYGATTGSAPSYRTVVARVADVEQVLDLSGTIEPSGRSDLSFGTDGRIAAVRTAVGRKVEQGDVIAVLDRTSLRAAVDRAVSDLAAAQARLAEDRAAQTSAVAADADAGSSSGSGSGSGSAGGGQGSGKTPSPALAKLTQQQDAVLAAQTAASTALAASAAALTTQQQACAASEPAGETPTDQSADQSADQPTDQPTADGVSEACATALAAVQSAQAKTADAQQSLQVALLALGKTLSAAAADASKPTATPTQTPSQTPTQQPAASPEATPEATPSGATRTVTAATLADDQASIDRARADLTQARANLRAAVVRAPADGTVTSLGVAAGDQVAAGDTIASVVAPGLTTITLQVSKDQAARLQVGAMVQVTPAGASDPLAGEISRVAHLPTASSDSSADPTYAVQVTLDQRDLALPEGLPASVAVVVGKADDVVTVPASALTNGTVQVVRDGKAERVRVTTGVVGSTDVQVVDGLDAGDRVVLADLDADVPTGDSEQRGIGGFGGGPGGSVRISGPGGMMVPAR